ncbi:MAG: GNAT family N-acetyltransferase [Actinomycetota bacterium]
MHDISGCEAVEHLETNLWSIWSVFGRGPGARLIDEPDVMAFETPLDRAPYSGIMRFRSAGGPTLVDDEIDRLLAPFRARGVAPMWLVHPTAEPADLGLRLNARGFDRAERLTGMTSPLGTLPDPDPTPLGIDVFEVAANEPSPWVGLVSWRYGLPTAARDFLVAVYRNEAVGPGGATRVWVAMRDGVPVAKAALHLHGESAGVYGVATRPEGRGLGLATQLTLTALRAARGTGARIAVLHSTPMAVSLYRRLGFEPIADFDVYAEPGGLDLH